MLRFLFPLVSLAIAALSIAVELSQRQADSPVCLHGGCRYDQIFATAATPATTAALLNEAPADPGIWCTYGEFFSSRGEIDKAQAAFDRALILGPGVSPVLMRIANFDFTHNRTEEGLRLAEQILRQTEEFDGIVFSYLGISGKPVSQLLGTAVPPAPRPARSWLGWVRSRGTDQDILDTWAWMRRNGFADEKSAVDTTNTLWQRKSYRAAQELWTDWLGPRRGDYPHPQLLANTHFQEAPNGTPFDWNFSSNASVELLRHDGLEVRFLGRENLSSPGVQQVALVEPGHYRFAAQISADNLTTDQGVAFQIVDAENPGRLTVETKPVLGNMSQSLTTLDFTVPGGTKAIQVSLVRQASLKFDNKIAGTLHIYQVSLLRSGG